MSLSATFRVAKIPRATLPPKSCKVTPSSVSASPASTSGDPPPKAVKKKKEAAPWCVYLIASAGSPAHTSASRLTSLAGDSSSSSSIPLFGSLLSSLI
ncbi:hypothetical protein VPH35_072532 [Triticum aestivum]